MPRPFPTLLRLINNVSMFCSLRTLYCIIQDFHDFQFTTKYYVSAKLALKKVMIVLPYNHFIFPPNQSTFMLRFLKYQYTLQWQGNDIFLCNLLCVNDSMLISEKSINTLYTIFCYTFHSLLTCMAVAALQYFFGIIVKPN